MTLRRAFLAGFAVTLAGVALLPACSRRKPVEVLDITPSIKINRVRAPLGSAVEVTYTWTIGPTFKKLAKDYRAFVHILDAHEVPLFMDDHAPIPPTSNWEAGKTYSYSRTVFIPVYPYVGEAIVRIGLHAGRERLGLKGEDLGFQEYKIARFELLPNTENFLVVYKDGWHNPESSPTNPSQEWTWTKDKALVSFKNPKKDTIIYLQADTNFKAFPEPPVLTVAVGEKVGYVLPIENSEVFLKKIRVKAEDLGKQDWVDLWLTMNQSFVPNKLNPPLNSDDRTLGLLVYHLYVADAEQVGELPAGDVVDATLLPPAPKTAAKAPLPAGKPGTRPVTPAAKPSPKPVTAAPKPPLKPTK